ncbi:MAG: flagellar biosynthetic protein FliR [Hyphomonadaceae bacterium]|nr:flagellar biosynthetic protein FliR [Hyphomonadaceae bacterium]
MTLTLYGVEIWTVALMFARIGAILMLLPGFGEPAIPARIRLSFALALAIMLAPALAQTVPQPAATALGMAGQVTGEIIIGVLIGGAARILVSALATAGQIAGVEIGIAFAQTADPTMTQSGQLLSVFLGVMGMALIFATGLDHMFLRGVAGSYQVIALGTPPPTGDAAQMALEATAAAFRVGFQIAMPLLAAGLLFRAGMGVLSRLIPQIQVFFVVLPLQILGGLVVLAIGLSAGMLIWLDSLQRYATWLG